MGNSWEQIAQCGTSSPVQSIAISLYQFLIMLSATKNNNPSRLSRSSRIAYASIFTTTKIETRIRVHQAMELGQEHDGIFFVSQEEEEIEITQMEGSMC